MSSTMCSLRLLSCLILFLLIEPKVQTCYGQNQQNTIESSMETRVRDSSMSNQHQLLLGDHRNQKPATRQLGPTQAAPLKSALSANNQMDPGNYQQFYHSSPKVGSSSGTSELLADTSSIHQRPQKQQQQDLRGYVQQRSNIELALRQVNTEENMFHPAPAFSIPDHDFDWLTKPIQPETLAPRNDDNQNNNNKEELASQQQQQNTIAPASQDNSNNIAAQLEVANMDTQKQMGPNAQHQLDETGHHHQHHQQQQQAFTTAQVGNQSIVTTMLPTMAELPNHVVYEGPATAPPPPPPGDYYFPSSERLPNQGKASNAWWALGIGAEFERASNLTRNDYMDYCAHSELLVSNKQRSLCRMHPRIVPVVARGIKLAIDECQSRFTTNRWNCSLVLQDSLQWQEGVQQQQQQQVFGEVMNRPNRERALLNALVAAGLAHAMTKACSQGELPEECSCDKRIKSKSNKGKIEWVACSDDIDYGARFSRDFTDNTDTDDSDTVAMINTHNYEVGRRVFKSATDITCTCQTQAPDQVANSLCQSKKCWKHLGPFTDIGDELIRRYESATHVQTSSRDPHKLRPVRRGVRKPKRKDLVYIEESPDYCTANSRLGILGTQNRRCNSTSIGSQDSCSLLCCGRGYQVVVEEIEEDCNCKFVWCCHLDCEKCKRQITNDVCN